MADLSREDFDRIPSETDKALAEARRQLHRALDAATDLAKSYAALVVGQDRLLRERNSLALRLRARVGDDRDAEAFLRGLPVSYLPVRVPENTGKHPEQSGESRANPDNAHCPPTCTCRVRSGETP